MGLYHVEWDSSGVACAYTSKNIKLVKALTRRGIEVITYGGASPCAHATEHVQVVDVPDHEPNRLYDCDWANGFKEFNEKAIIALKDRLQYQDFIGISAGTAHQPIAEAYPNFLSVETGIGYSGTFANFRVFESEAWRHTVYAQQHSDNGRFYDVVIPNLFDEDEFLPVCLDPKDHLAWLGRYIERKGPHVAHQIAQASGRFLMMAGQGVVDTSYEPYKIVGTEVTMEGEGFHHIGPVNATQRANFLSEAHALMVPTLYIGPFEGVAVEALMAGTPIITTPWGAFSEYVQEGVNGFRFHTLKEAVKAVEEVSTLDRKAIQKDAQSKFGLDAVGASYERYFLRLMDLWKNGWNELD